MISAKDKIGVNDLIKVMVWLSTSLPDHMPIKIQDEIVSNISNDVRHKITTVRNTIGSDLE